MATYFRQFLLFLILAMLLPTESFADSELFFPLNLNHVKILPQRFEYQLIDKDQIQIGDLRLNASQIDFQLIPINKAKTKFKIRFRWPSGFLKDGELVVKDSSGKAILTKSVLEKDLLQLKTPDQDRMRESMHAYDIIKEVPELLESLQKVPFFQFCVHREEPLTKIYLCSKDLYFKKNGQQISVKTRDSFRPESYVELNGKSVGPQGIIFLNDPSEFISMRTLLLSGATLELDTRMKMVEFKDVILSDDEKKLTIKAKGAEPVDESLVTRISANEWQIVLDTDRPLVYLKGEGDLPLRQEFLIQGSVRKEKTHVTVLTDSSDQIPTTTYDDKIVLKIKGNDGASLATADRLTSLVPTEDGASQWSLTNLKKNQDNRRYLKVTDDNKLFVAGFDIYRASANNAYFKLLLPLWAQIGLEHWFNPRWGGQIQYDQQMSKSTGDPDISALDARLKYRNPKGILGDDPYFGLIGSAKSLNINSTNIGILSLGLSGEVPSFMLKDIFQWMTFELMIPVMSLDSKYKLNSSFDFQISFRHFSHDTLYYDFGARYNSVIVQSESNGISTESKVQKPYLSLGMGWLF